MNLPEIERRERELRARAQEILARNEECDAKGNPAWLTKSIDRDIKELGADFDQVAAERKKHENGQALMTKMGGNPGGQKGFGSAETKTGRVYTPSPLTFSEAQYRGLFDAVQHKQPFRLEAETKTSTAFGEGSFASGTLPPILLPQNTLELAYEPDRLLDHFINQAAPIGPGVEWVAHTGNANPAAQTGELAVKPDLDMALTTHTVSWVKIAATATISMEIAQDFGVFMKFVPSELFRAITDAETDYFVNNGSNGLLNVAGVLTRSVGSDTNIDAIAKAANDIRVGSAFGEADLIAMHPSTFNSVRLSKATTGSYLLAPEDPASINSVNRIFDMDVVTNTKIPAGTAIVMDRKKAVIRWVRMGYTLETNAYGVAADGTNLWTQNAIGFRGEIREQIGVQYPTAINLLTGLPTG
jgi:HK97 family phage major capsid protein